LENRSLTYTTSYQRASSGRDLIFFDVITALGIVHFMLKTKGTALETVTTIYTVMWVMSLVVLMMLRVYGGRSGQEGDIVDYDENIRRDHLLWLIGSVAGISIINGLAAAGVAQGAHLFSSYVFQPSLAQATGTFSGTATLLDDILYNFFLVAQAEESIKIAATLAIYRKTRNLPISAGLPIAVWALFHAYLAYIGQGLDVFLISAFVSGVILFIVLMKTKSLINAVIAHGIWNSIVVLSTVLV